MKMMKHIQTWLLITLLVLSASGVANAKLASGHQNLSADLHQSQTVLNALLHQGLEQASTTNVSESPLATKRTPHKNSLDYVGETHVYRVKGPNGTTHKIGESAQGTRVRDGASKRAEQQARQLTRETGDTYTSEIRKTFPGKASARDYETRVIERFRRIYGQDTLPGNKTNR